LRIAPQAQLAIVIKKLMMSAKDKIIFGKNKGS
jgi:hypothetical protein